MKWTSPRIEELDVRMTMADRKGNLRTPKITTPEALVCNIAQASSVESCTGYSQDGGSDMGTESVSGSSGGSGSGS